MSPSGSFRRRCSASSACSLRSASPWQWAGTTTAAPSSCRNPTTSAPRFCVRTQQELWSLAGDAVNADPDGTAPRLYIETLNAMIDSHNDLVTSLRNRVPSTVLVLQVFGSAIAVGVLALYLALLGRGLITSLVATRRHDPHPVHLLRPRPTPPRTDHGPRQRARRVAGSDEPTTGRHRSMSATRPAAPNRRSGALGGKHDCWHDVRAARSDGSALRHTRAEARTLPAREPRATTRTRRRRTERPATHRRTSGLAGLGRSLVVLGFQKFSTCSGSERKTCPSATLPSRNRKA